MTFQTNTEPVRYYSPTSEIEPMQIDNCRGISVTRERGKLEASYFVPLTQENRRKLILCSQLDVKYLYDYDLALVNEEITFDDNGGNFITRIGGHELEIWSVGRFTIYL